MIKRNIIIFTIFLTFLFGSVFTFPTVVDAQKKKTEQTTKKKIVKKNTKKKVVKKKTTKKVTKKHLKKKVVKKHTHKKHLKKKYNKKRYTKKYTKKYNVKIYTPKVKSENTYQPPKVYNKPEDKTPVSKEYIRKEPKKDTDK